MEGITYEVNSVSRLKRVLQKGDFAVTAECGPPKGADPEAVLRKADLLREKVDAVNVTDNQTAIVRMCSLAACSLLKSTGLDPVLQVVVRDRNRIALQSDILGASAMGVGNVLCLSGDHQGFGNQPQAVGVFDLDSIQFVNVVKIMRDEGKILGGESLSKSPDLFIGAAANPFAEPFEWRVHRLAKKIKAGADFIQTQCIYNMEKMREWIHRANDMGLTEKAYILAGITPMKSLGMAKYMKAKVPGMDVPDEIIKRLQGAKKGEVGKEGIKIACEQVEEFKEMKGVAGIHLMAIEWEHKVPEIAEQAGVLPRPQVD